VIVGEPDLTIRDLLDHLDGKFAERSPEMNKLFTEHDQDYHPSLKEDGQVDFSGIKGLAWRDGGKFVLNFPRPFIKNLDDMPIPMHELLHCSATVALD